MLAAFLLAAAATLAAQAPPVPAVPQPPLAPPRFIVVLDAAHGGDDPGGSLTNPDGGGQPEKAFTLALSVRLRSLLAARGFQVITTRESDAAVDSDRRAEIANRANAQACLSLHAAETGSGVHLFASSLSPAAPTRIPAWKTAQAAWVTRSLALAGVVNSALLQAGLPVTLGRATLPAVDSMTCPALAVEVAPDRSAGSNPADSFIDPAYQARIAEALATALLEWKSEARQP
ncbi:MAG: N-acetylmuramoyl-L-alanine amidase [Terracidiphilus sp.]|nr:N-acetylmuramoyl-L-alanine amidase [Terracidiphilus sp.]